MSGTPVAVAETQEKIHRSKTRIGDTQAGYLEEKIVGSEYINITEDDGAVGKCLVVEVDAAAIVSGVVDHKVKVDTSDVAEFLESKITAGTAIAITEKTVSGKKNLEIAGAYTEGAGIDITADVIKLDANLDDLKDVVIGAGAEGQLISYDSGTSKFVNTDYAMETTFSGTTSKVPNSDAVADLLRALYITDATDCGSGGDSIMQKTQHIPASSITVIEKVGTNAIFSGDYPALSSAILDDSKWDTTAGCRSFNGMIEIKSSDGGSAETETSSFVVAVIPFGINEDAVGTNFWVDVLFYCPATSDLDETTVVGALPIIYVGDGTDQPTPGSVVEKTINYDDEVGKVVYKTFEFARGDTSTTASGGIIIMVNITDSNNFDAQILSARVRYETKTINLRKADVYEEV